ncbi:MAG: DUF2203 domain-containing protein [Firmicutes bacterium]|nr:DUF2203 domain-containing protein [Bacillota bacterium]
MAVRFFTVTEANRLVPSLTETMQRLRDLQTEAREKYEEMRRIRQVGYRTDGNLIMLADYQRAKHDFDHLVAEANRRLGEVHEMGCRVTDVELGLVDFPARLDSHEVYLCWQLGEDQVAYYHGLREGYGGRRPLPPADAPPAVKP